jgi:hypothetical protein
MARRRNRSPEIAVAATLLLFATATAQAQQSTPLRGEMFLAGRTPVDPPPGEPKNSHAYATVTGPAALRMYRAMPATEEENSCEEGKKLKRAGALRCSISANGRTATCDFSIDLIKGALADGRPC